MMRWARRRSSESARHLAARRACPGGSPVPWRKRMFASMSAVTARCARRFPPRATLANGLPLRARPRRRVGYGSGDRSGAVEPSQRGARRRAGRRSPLRGVPCGRSRRAAREPLEYAEQRAQRTRPRGGRTPARRRPGVTCRPGPRWPTVAATAILGEEAWARTADQNDERIPWALAAMQSELGREVRVETRTGRRRGLDRPRSAGRR